MIRFLKQVVSIFFLIVFLFGCGEEAPAPATKMSSQKKVKATMPKKEVVASPDVTDQEAAVESYSYNPTNRRDPFVALLEMRRPVVESNEPLTPLQRIDLEQLRLRGVIIGKGAPMAMVAAPGGKAYILKNGVKVGRNNGVVVGIDAEGVSVREKYYDFVGEVRESVQKIELPKREGAN
jgi:type IV pilus assembly protein PilP